jgi:hypothetical protein
MRLVRLAVPLFCLAVLGCVTAAPPPPAGPPNPADVRLFSATASAGNNFQGTVNGAQLSLTIQGRTITGPVTNLDISGGHVRGTGSSGRSIDVGIKGNKAEGLVGMTLFSCIVDFNPDGSAHVTGAMGAGNTDFILSPRVINGRIGVVAYNLSWTGSQYQGQMEPGGYGYLTLPVVMTTWSPVEAVTVLSLLLMGA